MAPPHFERVAIVGVGLLGASLGLAIKANALADCIMGVGRRQSSLDQAKAVGALNEMSLSLREGVRDADLVVLATPAAYIIPALDEIRTSCAPHAIVTDVASTKEAICNHAQATWPTPRRFVGSHPMAGSEKFGPIHGRVDFYQDTVCLVENQPDLDPQAHQQVCALWRAVGARVVEVEPKQHDAMLARTSHLPHVLAAVMADLAVQQGDVRAVIGNGFRDFTRIAASRPEVWRDICVTNHAALSDSVQELVQALNQFDEVLRTEDAAAVEAFFARGNVARRKAVEE